MKRIRLAFVIIAAMLLTGFLYMNFLNSSVDMMLSEASEAYNRIDTDYENVPEHFEKISHELDKNGIIYCAFINQSLLSDVDNKILECLELHRQGNKDELKLTLVQLRAMLEHLRATEEFDLKKIM